jgi:hypothetical protein
LEILGPRCPFDLERISLGQIQDRLTQAEKQEEEAFRKLTQKAADGNLSPVTNAAVLEFTSAVNHVEDVTNEENVALRMYGPRVVNRLYRNLRIVSIVGGVLFLAGWCLSLVGHIYGLEGMKAPE